MFYRVSAADALVDTHILKHSTGKHCCFPVLRSVFDFAVISAGLDIRFDLSGKNRIDILWRFVVNQPVKFGSLILVVNVHLLYCIRINSKLRSIIEDHFHTEIVHILFAGTDSFHLLAFPALFCKMYRYSDWICDWKKKGTQCAEQTKYYDINCIKTFIRYVINSFTIYK